jgi:hypothetical protein
LAEFYRAFNTRDLALMERNWISSDEASMDNPLGGSTRPSLSATFFTDD